MSAIIYRPSRNAMQSGKAKSKHWVLVHERTTPRQIEPLMGYTASSDMNTQVRLSFDSCEEAEEYARAQGLSYRVQPAHNSVPKRSAYTDNFQHNRKTPWTH